MKLIARVYNKSVIIRFIPLLYYACTVLSIKNTMDGFTSMLFIYSAIISSRESKLNKKYISTNKNQTSNNNKNLLLECGQIYCVYNKYFFKTTTTVKLFAVLS